MGAIEAVEAFAVALGIIAVTAFLYPVAANIGNPQFPIVDYLLGALTSLATPSPMWAIIAAAVVGGIGLAYSLHTGAIDDD